MGKEVDEDQVGTGPVATDADVVDVDAAAIAVVADAATQAATTARPKGRVAS